VRDIGRHLLESAHQALDSIEHHVHVFGEAIHLVPGPARRQTAVQRPIDDLATDSMNEVKAIERPAAECRATDDRQHDRDGDAPSEGPARKFLHFDQTVRVLADDHEVSARQ
jgi:hypothetical protein